MLLYKITLNSLGNFIFTFVCHCLVSEIFFATQREITKFPIYHHSPIYGWIDRYTNHTYIHLYRHIHINRWITETIRLYPTRLLCPWWLSGKESACQGKRHRRRRFNPWVRQIPWSRRWQHTPEFLSGKFYRQRSLVEYSPWGCKKNGTWLSMHAFLWDLCMYELSWFFLQFISLVSI